jgi:hypothetical protein
MAEPLVLLALAAFPGGASTDNGLPMLTRLIPGWGLSLSSGATALAVYGAEFALGLALVAVPLALRLGRETPTA